MSAAVRLDAATADRFYTAGTALNRVLAEAPYLPRCSDDKTATRVRPKEYAIRYPYMQINRPGLVSWLIFDLDHRDSMRWEHEGLPPPNLIVRNRKNGHSHLFYAITPVCTSERARSAPIAYMKAIYAAFSARLAADPDFHSGPVAKTPGHPWWLTEELHGQTYELGELAEYVELPRVSPWAQTPNTDRVSHSRHCTLFELLRHYAYSIVGNERKHGSFDTFTRLLESFAHDKNRFSQQGFSSDLAFSSIKSTVKSVARWTWDKYTGAGKNCRRGAMQLDDNLPLQERQQAAAARTHEIRNQATAAKIRDALRQLSAKATKPTLTAIAKLTRMTRQTVANYKHLFDATPEASPAGMIEQKEELTQAEPVKYAGHQVTAAVRPAGFVLENKQSGGEAAAEPHALSGQQAAQGGKPPSRVARPSSWIPTVIRSNANE